MIALSPLLISLLAGINWMDPQWLFQHYQAEFVWLCLAIIVVECGLFFPVLPGDTLLFSIGIFIASKSSATHLDMNLFVAIVVFTLAAFLGNVVGYEIGRLVGPPLAQRDGRILKKKYFEEAHEFFEKHGTKALVIGRFVPFVRTYVTVVAGIAQMDRRKFATWSAIGAVAWVGLLILLGYFLGATFPSMASQIDKVVLVLLTITILPIAWEWIRRRRARRTETM